MYAIAFDLDTTQLEIHYPGFSWQNAYATIAKFLEPHGFSRQQGSVYFGNDGVTDVATVVAVQQLALAYPWFAPSVKDIRMLRIEAHNDLQPALQFITSIAVAPPAP